jgi:hypothetical protein
MPPRRAKTPVGANVSLKFPEQSISFDVKAFDNLLNSQGIKIRHLRAMPDPRLLNSRGDYRRSDEISTSDGLVYKEAGCFTAPITTSSKDVNLSSEGEIDQATAYVTPPKFYDGTQEPIILNVYDRFELVDIEVRVVSAQLVEANTTGVDRLNWPAVCVEHCMGGDGFEYIEGTHFKVNQFGEIEWLTQKRPAPNYLGRPEAYSIRYRYIPFWVVRRLIHEIRVAQVTSPIDGRRYVERLPYQVQIARENVYRDRQRTSDSPEQDPRFQDSPTVGNSYIPGNSWGPGDGSSE